MPKIFKLVASIILCQGAGLIGSLFTVRSVGGWYLSLNKPSFNPPSWLFGPVWITLYLLMGISLYLVWIRWPAPQTKAALALFGAQLLLNALWSFLFFGLKRPGIAFAEIILLFVLIAATLYVFSKITKPAALLLLPYLLWVAFASVLNYSIWRLN